MLTHNPLHKWNKGTVNVHYYEKVAYPRYIKYKLSVFFRIKFKLGFVEWESPSYNTIQGYSKRSVRIL